MANKKASTQGKKKAAKGKTGAKGGGSSVDRLLVMQQQAVTRYAEYASSVANRLSQGDLNLSSWVADYSKVWRALVGDMDDMVKAMLPDSK